MLGKNIIRKSFTLSTLVAVWCVYSMVAFALPKDTGDITVTGQVTVNGQPAVTGATILSGAVINTAPGSSAVVSLGKLGRVEVLSDTTVTLNFGPDNIIAVLDMGKVRVASTSGTPATVTTKNATFVADPATASIFAVEAECSHSHVDATAGVVTMREGSSSKQVAAGTTATAGNLTQTGCKPCLRPDSSSGPAIAGAPWLIALAAGVVGVTLWLASGDGETTTSGGAVIISPTR